MRAGKSSDIHRRTSCCMPWPLDAVACVRSSRMELLRCLVYSASPFCTAYSSVYSFGKTPKKHKFVVVLLFIVYYRSIFAVRSKKIKGS